MDEKKLSVKKSNTLVESRHKLNTHQQRAFMLFVSKIRANDTPDKIYRLKWHELDAISKGYLSTRSKITELFEGMLSKRIKLSRDNADVDERTTFFSYFKNDYIAQEVHVRVDISIQQELFELLNNYTLYSLECALNLDSPYYIRMYEILKSKQFKAQYGPVEIALDELKWSLGCDDVKTYSLWTDFKRYILDKAKVDLAKHTDIKFKYKPLKTGRKVVGLAFFIEENEKWQSTINALLPEKPKQLPRSKPRDFVREGDIVMIGGEHCKVGASACEHQGKVIPIGQLSTLLKAGKIELVAPHRETENIHINKP